MSEVYPYLPALAGSGLERTPFAVLAWRGHCLAPVPAGLVAEHRGRIAITSLEPDEAVSRLAATVLGVAISLEGIAAEHAIAMTRGERFLQDAQSLASDDLESGAADIIAAHLLALETASAALAPLPDRDIARVESLSRVAKGDAPIAHRTPVKSAIARVAEARGAILVSRAAILAARQQLQALHAQAMRTTPSGRIEALRTQLASLQADLAAMTGGR